LQFTVASSNHGRASAVVTACFIHPKDKPRGKRKKGFLTARDTGGVFRGKTKAGEGVQKNIPLGHRLPDLNSGSYRLCCDGDYYLLCRCSLLQNVQSLTVEE